MVVLELQVDQILFVLAVVVADEVQLVQTHLLELAVLAV
jgi:hypothetical protein